MWVPGRQEPDEPAPAVVEAALVVVDRHDRDDRPAGSAATISTISSRTMTTSTSPPLVGPGCVAGRRACAERRLRDVPRRAGSRAGGGGPKPAGPPSRSPRGPDPDATGSMQESNLHATGDRCRTTAGDAGAPLTRRRSADARRPTRQRGATDSDPGPRAYARSGTRLTADGTLRDSDAPHRTARSPRSPTNPPVPAKETHVPLPRRSSPRRPPSTPTATCPAASTTPSRPGSRPSPSTRSSRRWARTATRRSRARAIDIKEQRADLAKHHLDVLWHDYFKPEHLEKVPNLHELFWNATKQVSKVKASTDIADAKKLLDMIDEIDAAWKATGGEEKTRVAGRALPDHRP